MGSSPSVAERVGVPTGFAEVPHLHSYQYHIGYQLIFPQLHSYHIVYKLVLHRMVTNALSPGNDIVFESVTWSRQSRGVIRWGGHCTIIVHFQFHTLVTIRLFCALQCMKQSMHWWEFWCFLQCIGHSLHTLLLSQVCCE